MNDLQQARWTAVSQRDKTHDGLFYYAVRTTGIYCRPGCAARRPRQENVEYFATAAEAVAAGYRACRRCRPDQLRVEDPIVASVIAVCRRLEHPDDPGDPSSLAAELGWSRRYLERRFREIVGVTMAAYLRAQRAERVRNALRAGTPVTEAVFDAGYGSTRAFYEHGAPRLGMAPTEYSEAGRGQEIGFTVVSTSLGLVILAVTQRGICAVRIGGDRTALIDELTGEFASADLVEAADELDPLAKHIQSLAEGMEASDDPLPLDIRGTAFQVRVWEELRKIPLGTTVTYGDIATAVGKPTAARAVANACAANPAALVIPCHRVVRADGSVGGYRWGPETKRVLIAAEDEHQGHEPERFDSKRNRR